MKQTMKRSLALLMALVMCLTFLPVLFLGTSAAEVDYQYSGKYIYNWGTREEVATFLSPNAEKFYANDTYEELSSYAGGTGTSDAPKSALYNALQDLMESNHTHQTSYAETRDLYKYTDCQNSGGKISSFYSGKEIGPAWDGSSWNREHTWPNSKGLAGNDENDIMMLRPTSTSENGARGNKAYGQSSGYYNPNSESGGKHDLRGDVARIFLYVYVRWGNVNGNGQYTAWGSSGVMESLDVLLAWMEADPVDTWELGRNDSVESITGTRNVFVDYPEFAFLLFGVEIPEDMITPSGEAANSNKDCGHNNFDAGVITAPTCTAKGYTIYTCKTANCGYSYKTNITEAVGHIYVSGVCSACGEAEPVAPVKPTYVTEVVPGKAYKLGFYSTDKSAEYFFSGAMNGFYGETSTEYSKGVDVYAEQASGGFYLYFNNANGQKQYINLIASGNYRNFTYDATATSVYTWDAAKNAFYTTVSDEICYMGTYSYYVTVGVLQTSKLKDTDYIARFYTMGEGAGDPTCQHNYTSVVTAPTCTTEGYTTYTCTLCNDMYLGEKTAAKGHTYSGGVCIRCGAQKPSQTEITISFETTESRTSFSTSQQVWEQNGIKVVNDKASATSPVADYCNPARFYQGSNVTISYPGMTKVVIDCSDLDSKYVDSWLNVTGATATKNGGIVTIVFDEPTDTLTYTALVKQSRAYSITVYAAAQEQACEHTNLKTEGAISATCSTEGRTGYIICVDCGEILQEDSIIPTGGHVYAAWVIIKAPSCSAAGLERRDCDNCTHYETKQIATLEHTDDDNNEICDVCEKSLVETDDTTTDTTDTTEHTCKEVSGFQAFINSIINFFRRLFGQPELCACGEVILEKEEN